MALQELYPLFKNTKKQRLSKDFDLFAQDHAPLYRMDAVKRQFSVAEHELEKALDRANEIRVAPWDSESMDHEMIAELEERKEMVTDGGKLGKEALKTLEAMKTYTTMIDEESTRNRKEIADYVLSILPDAKDMLVKIDLHIQGEMKRLRVDNTELIGQNAVLKSQAEQAGSSKDAEIMAMLQKLQGNLVVKMDAENTEFERLKEVEEVFVQSKERWDHARQTFEENEEHFRVDIEQLKEELEIRTARLKQMERLRQEADEDIEELENEKEKLGEELAKERKNALDEKQHARELQTSLGEELDEKERKDWQIRQLEEDMQQLCQSKDERIQQLDSQIATLRPFDVDQLVNCVELLKNTAAEKDDKIAKLETKIQRTDLEFEWVKGRSLEYYGDLKMAEVDNKRLRDAIDKLCDTLSVVKAEVESLQLEKEGWLAEDTARDEIIDQMMQASKALETMKSSRRSSIVGAMDWESAARSRPVSRLARSSDPPSASRQTSPARDNQRTPVFGRSGTELTTSRRSSTASRMECESPVVQSESSEATTPRRYGRNLQTPPTSFIEASADLRVAESSASHDTTPRQAPHTHSSDVALRSMIPVPVTQSSGLRASSNVSQSSVVPSRSQQTTLDSGIGMSNSRQNSNHLSTSSSYVTPYCPQGDSTSYQTGYVYHQGVGSSTLSDQQLNRRIPGPPAPSMQPPASVTYIPPIWSAGTFGPPLQQLGFIPYTFLISGELDSGIRNLLVSPAIIRLVDAQFAEWNRRTRDTNHWSSKSKASHKRCVHTRIVAHLTNAQNPARSDTPNVACTSCITKGLACVLIGNHGPVVVPLPVADRSPGATAMQGDFFVKTRVPTTWSAGTLGPPLQQQPPVSQRYSFLVSGQLASGHRTLSVDLSVIQRMNSQITRWEGNSHVNWAGPSAVSHKRCSETRVQQFRKTKNPPASENPNEACANCVANKMICVLVGGNGPVVVPLPVSERSPGATPTSGDYYVKS
jgi:hypothetical protein